MPDFRIAAAQIPSRRGDIDANLATHATAMAAASRHGVSVLVFPELSLTGYEPTLAAGDRRNRQQTGTFTGTESALLIASNLGEGEAWQGEVIALERPRTIPARRPLNHRQLAEPTIPNRKFANLQT